ncbi:MAG: CapA family protein [Alphaproteobacteria bacterium]|nr:MAG: CapA family protein [Alphaproteobacteria bacterium]
MKKSELSPVALPQDAFFALDALPEAFRSEILQELEPALVERRWEAPIRKKIDPRNIDFIVYWLYKTKLPIQKGLEGFDLEQYFEPFRRKRWQFDVPTCSSGDHLRMSAVGDLMYALDLEQSRDRMYSRVEDLIFGADIRFANLESTLSPGEIENFTLKEAGDTPKINININEFETLIQHKDKRYSVVQLANNHIFDCGEEGVQTTLEELKNRKMDFVGVYESADAAAKPQIQNYGPFQIGWVAHTFGVNDKPLPEGKSWMCNVTPFCDDPDLSIAQIREQIDACRKSGCDLVVASLHWGMEHELYPYPEQMRWAHEMAEWGVDIIIGHHPHVAQMAEIYTPKSFPEKRVPILYSLGNLTPFYGSPQTCLSLIANIHLATKGGKESQGLVVTGLELSPVIFMTEKEGGTANSVLVPLEEAQSLAEQGEHEEYLAAAIDWSKKITGD